MATIKSFTSLEQSKKLAEILPLESADMHYCLQQRDVATGYEIGITPFIKVNEYKGKCNIIDVQPAWSLAALLGVLPQSITKYIKSESCQKTFHLNLFRSYYYCCSYSFNPSISDDDGNNTLYCIGRDNWIDACYEMILKLHELKML